MIPAIRVVALSKKFGGKWRQPEKVALQNVSFEVLEGEAFGFVGANGAGKSTTIKTLIGALRPTNGEAQIFGLPVGLPQSRLGLGYVPENASLYDYLTPIELLEMGMQLHRAHVANVRKHCMDWLDRFGLAESAHKRIAGFSKGMVQRATLAHAMAIQPRLLILDEPLSGLDPIGRRDVVNLLGDYKQAGGTIFFTSHVLHDVERLADRFGLIHRGVLQAVRSPMEFVGGEERLSIRTIGDVQIEGMRPESRGRWCIEVSREALWPYLDQLKQSGHSIIEIRPALNLEAAFLSVVTGEGK